MMIRAAIAALGLFAFMGGCASAPAPMAPPPPVSPPMPPPPEPPRPTSPSTESGRFNQGPGVALPNGYQVVSNVLSPAQSYLPRGDRMPTGVVLLDPSARAQNEALCRGLLGRGTATVPTQAEARANDPTGDLLVTHWLLRGPVEDAKDCRQLLEGYDFERARRIKAAYAISNSNGPILLALDPSGEVVFLDLKRSSPEEVYDTVRDWIAVALRSPLDTGAQGAPQLPGGIATSMNRLFAQIATGFSSLVGDQQPTVLAFNDPLVGTERQFRLYQTSRFLVGATFRLS
ncbi:hypothetical protein GC169_09455 [bacterium]|nr:hypothetical protein [bacterium]